MTNFTKRVLKVVSQIEPGKTMTYQEVAHAVGSPRAYRAVGNILMANFDEAIPCHRVIKSNGEIGQYNRGAERKKELIKMEKNSKNNLFIPVILGTSRQNRQSEKATNYVFKRVLDYGVESELVDVRSMTINETIPSWVNDERADQWRKIANKADAFVFVVPEYNHGVPGELKMLIDRAKKEYFHKPVVVCGVSNGNFGGVRVADNMLPIWITLNMFPLKSTVFFSNVETLFDKLGNISDPSFNERLSAMMDELTWLALLLNKEDI